MKPLSAKEHRHKRCDGESFAVVKNRVYFAINPMKIVLQAISYATMTLAFIFYALYDSLENLQTKYGYDKYKILK